MDGNSRTNWYVLKVVTGQENKIKAYIESDLARENLSDCMSEILIPKERVYQIKNGKKISKEKAFFPGYLILHVDLLGEVVHLVKSIPGVVGFLSESKGGEPLPMRKSEVNRVLGRMDELSDVEEDVNIPYVLGESVKVIDGPFNGFDGSIEKINEEKRKLEVMVKIFGRKTPIELGYMQVQKIL